MVKITRPLLYGPICVIALIFAIAGVASPAFTASSNGFKTTSTLWRSCTKGNGYSACVDVDDATSDCVLSHVRAMRAFGLLALFALVFGVVLAVMDFFGWLARLLKKFTPHAPIWTDKAILIGLAAAVWVFALIFWAVFAGLWENGCDGSKLKDSPNSKWGAAAPLFILVWLLSAALIVVVLFAPRRQVVVKTTEPTHMNAVGAQFQPQGQPQTMTQQPAATTTTTTQQPYTTPYAGPN